ncbi:MAG: hypothetical protein WAK20_07060 [Candidatus Acidiferrum sp.]
MEKQWLRTEKSTVAFFVDEKPSFAGIDSHNKLIDRDPPETLIAIEEK